MSSHASRIALIFSCLGHAYMHFFAACFFVIVLRLETEWQIAYPDAIELWTLGALLVGVVAIPAGWLGDRWSAPGMMVVMFLGMGAAAIACGFATTPQQIFYTLSALGLFAAIYHPVAVAWLVRNATARGKALGINGIFGSLGVASSAALTGVLIHWFDWQAAFIVPGIVSVITGLVLWTMIARGALDEAPSSASAEISPSRSDMVRGFGLLLITMTAMGLSFHVVQTALPKVFSVRLTEWQSDPAAIGSLLGMIYLMAGFMQLIGGHLADRYPLKPLYTLGLLVQVPVYVLVTQLVGMPLVFGAFLAIFLNASVLPAENMLIARYTPANRRSLAFGVKFVLAFATAPLAVILVARLVEWSGEFVWVFLLIAGLLTVSFLAALALPAERRALRVAKPMAVSPG